MAYEIWLSASDTERIHFQVNPETLTIDTGESVDTVTLAELGEISKKRGNALKRLRFKSFFPNGSFPGINFDYYYNPYTIKGKLQQWKDDHRVCHLVITDCYIWMYVKINKLTWEENGGDVGVQHFDIELIEYRKPTVRRIDMSKDEERQDNRENSQSVSRTYTVAENDCLWSIAQSQLGDGNRWKEIYNLNTDKIKSDNIIYSGQVLVLPE